MYSNRVHLTTVREKQTQIVEGVPNKVRTLALLMLVVSSGHRRCDSSFSSSSKIQQTTIKPTSISIAYLCRMSWYSVSMENASALLYWYF